MEGCVIIPAFMGFDEFADGAERAAFKANPLKQQSIDSVCPLRDLRIAADFESGGF